MTHFVWTEEYELGISVIDAQHKRIIDYINRINDVIDHDVHGEDIPSILNHLVDYTFSHLAFEEALLEEVGYNEFNLHKLSHNSFSKLIQNLRDRSIKGEAVAVELATFLQNWLISHIMTEDAKYVDSVNTYLMGNEAGRRRYWLHKTMTRYFQ